MTDPERLDALLAGAPPRDEEERGLLALAREVRDAAAPASPELRARVRRLAHAPTPWWRRGAPAWRRAGAVAAPLALAAVAAALVVPSLRDDGRPAAPAPAEERAAAPAGGAAEIAPSAAAPAPALIVRLDSDAGLLPAGRRLTTAVRDAGGRVLVAERGPRRVRIVARVPAPRVDALLTRAERLGTVTRRGVPVSGGPRVTVIVVIIAP